MWSLCAWVHTMPSTRAPADGLRDRGGVVGGVDHDDLALVADDPDVVVHVPGAAVEGELPGGDEPFDPSAAIRAPPTERSTSPWCIALEGLLHVVER